MKCSTSAWRMLFRKKKDRDGIPGSDVVAEVCNCLSNLAVTKLKALNLVVQDHTTSGSILPSVWS